MVAERPERQVTVDQVDAVRRISIIYSGEPRFQAYYYAALSSDGDA